MTLWPVFSSISSLKLTMSPCSNLGLESVREEGTVAGLVAGSLGSVLIRPAKIPPTNTKATATIRVIFSIDIFLITTVLGYSIVMAFFRVEAANSACA